MRLVDLKASTIICGTVLLGLVIVGAFYLVGIGRPVAEVVTLVGGIATAVTGIITVLVRMDHQDSRLDQIEHNTNGRLQATVVEAVKEAVDDHVVPAVAAAAERTTHDDR
jgi:uncharacterized membrane protein